MNERIYTPLHDHLASGISARSVVVCRESIPLNPAPFIMKPRIAPPTSQIDNSEVSIDSAEHTALLRMVRTHVGRALLCLSLLLSPLFVSCYGDDTLRYAEMQDFYVESQTLPEVSLDSVDRFSGKVDGFVGVHPDAVDDPLYPKIQDNIRSASIRITITVEDAAWKDTLYYTF